MMKPAEQVQRKAITAGRRYVRGELRPSRRWRWPAQRYKRRISRMNDCRRRGGESEGRPACDRRAAPDAVPGKHIVRRPGDDRAGNRKPPRPAGQGVEPAVAEAARQGDDEMVFWSSSLRFTRVTRSFSRGRHDGAGVGQTCGAGSRAAGRGVAERNYAKLVDQRCPVGRQGGLPSWLRRAGAVGCGAVLHVGGLCGAGAARANGRGDRTVRDSRDTHRKILCCFDMAG